MQQRTFAIAAAVCALTLAGCDREPQPEATAAQVGPEETNHGEDEEPAPTDDAEPKPADEAPGAALVPDEPGDDETNGIPDTLKTPRYSGIGTDGTIRHRPHSVPEEVEAVRERREEDGKDPNRFPFEPQHWSDSYGNVEAIEVLTTDEPIRVRFGEFRKKYNGMSWDPILETEPSERLADTVLRATFYADVGVFSPESRIKERLASESVDEQLAERLWERAIGDLQDYERQILEEYFEQVDDSIDDPALDDYFKQHRADFSAQHTRLITLGVRIGTRAGYNDEHDCFGAGYVADDDGDNIKVAVAPHLEFHCFDPERFVDLDGDGTWGVIYTRGRLPHPVDLDMVEFDDDGEPTHRGLHTWH